MRKSCKTFLIVGVVGAVFGLPMLHILAQRRTWHLIARYVMTITWFSPNSLRSLATGSGLG